MASIGRPNSILGWQVLFGLVPLALWELASRYFTSTWTSSPLLIFRQLGTWLAGDLWRHVAMTMSEVFLGLLIGSFIGTIAGLLLGRSQVVALVLRPMILAVYSIPLISLAPLFILWFGIDLIPKVLLVSVLVTFLMFFNTFYGAQSIDPDLIATFRLMGADRREQFWKIIFPGSTAWITSGMKMALPFALVGATAAEMLAARSGLGFLLNDTAARFDMTGLYTALFVVMVIGVAMGQIFAVFERWLLRWRHGGA